MQSSDRCGLETGLWEAKDEFLGESSPAARGETMNRWPPTPTSDAADGTDSNAPSGYAMPVYQRVVHSVAARY